MRITEIKQGDQLSIWLKETCSASLVKRKEDYVYEFKCPSVAPELKALVGRVDFNDVENQMLRATVSPMGSFYRPRPGEHAAQIDLPYSGIFQMRVRHSRLEFPAPDTWLPRQTNPTGLTYYADEMVLLAW